MPSPILWLAKETIMPSRNAPLSGADWNAYRQMQRAEPRKEKAPPRPTRAYSKEPPRSLLKEHLRNQRHM
jgi:hypothetical protein